MIPPSTEFDSGIGWKCVSRQLATSAPGADHHSCSAAASTSNPAYSCKETNTVTLTLVLLFVGLDIIWCQSMRMKARRGMPSALRQGPGAG